MKVYLDNCAYNRPFDDQSQIRIFLEAQSKMHLQTLILDKKVDLAYSYMSEYENNDNPDDEHRAIIAQFLKNAVSYVDYGSADVVETHAAHIMGYHIKHKDAIHLSSAIKAQCDCFITTDDGILRNYKGTDIKVCSPIDFVTGLEDENA
jgi:predicted nucleic acid-binding protein